MKNIIYKEFDFYYRNVYRNVIDTGNYYGFNYYIISMGSHPCCYVEIPKEHKLFKKHYTEIEYKYDIQVHGGITYSADHLMSVDETGTKWFLGWDYAHYGDYQYFDDKIKFDGHKYTVEELKEEVQNFCKQIYKIN